jgi:hypothetical protein
MLDVGFWMLVEGRRFAPVFLVLTNIQRPKSNISLLILAAAYASGLRK